MTDSPFNGEPAPALTVRYLDEVYRPLQELVFGRDAELAIDDNSYLHRQAGRFRQRNAVWWLENIGSRLRLTMVSAEGSVMDLHPGGASPLLGTAGEISLTAGPTRYSLEYELEHDQMELNDPLRRALGDDADNTKTFFPLLTPREIDFVVVMARGRLTGRLGPLPTHGEIAETWGVSAKTVDNTLQRLRAKLRAQNLRLAQSTETMIDYLVAQGLVSLADLEWARLDHPDGPRSAAARTP